MAKSSDPKSGDPINDLIVGAAEVLQLPTEPDWLPAIRTNLQVTLNFAKQVDEFELPDYSEPAHVFRA
jgi:hypothetical protein